MDLTISPDLSLVRVGNRTGARRLKCEPSAWTRRTTSGEQDRAGSQPADSGGPRGGGTGLEHPEHERADGELPIGGWADFGGRSGVAFWKGAWGAVYESGTLRPSAVRHSGAWLKIQGKSQRVLEPFHYVAESLPILRSRRTVGRDPNP